MEGSRRGKRSREKGLLTPDPHVDERNGVKKTIVYNMKKEKRKGTQKKDWRKRRKRKSIKVEEIQQQEERT